MTRGEPVDAEELAPVVESLAEKLANADLDASEAHVLIGALMPESGEVEGFAYDLNPNDLSAEPRRAYDLNPNDLSLLINARLGDGLVFSGPWFQGTKFRC